MEKSSAKYKKVYESLRNDILSGKYSSGSAFPSSTALARRFRLTRFTIRQALDILVKDGLIRSCRGRGTYVTRMGANRRIGLIVPGVAYTEFFQPVMMALSAVCSENGYGLCVGGAFSEKAPVRARQALALARDYVEQDVCGVILQPIESIPNAPGVNKRILSVFKDAGIPVVLLDSDVVPMPGRSGYDLVGINNFDAGRQIAVHLLASGARRIAFAAMPHPSYSIRNRFAGVQNVLAMHGVLLENMTELDAANVSEVRKMLVRDRPDSVICCCDTFAAYMKGSLEKLGRRVPDDILLAGFDDVQHARIMTPSLTTARQPCAEIANEAFRTLVERMENPDRPVREILLTAPLIVRASSKGDKAGVDKRRKAGNAGAKKPAAGRGKRILTDAV